MLELVFFSTNLTKVAHFRYLGQKVGIKVKSFKEANYYASYHEPKIDDRAELLGQSYASALKQWRRRCSIRNDEMSTFFFEDTSVRIDCLSREKETPGVNVKFWMQGMTFERLDEMLKANGNDRRVAVRSDIVMHLPNKWKRLLGIETDFLWVHGEVHGYVSEVELAIEPNLVYPWLDNKTFNRWFVPEGASLPVSALSIEEAQKGDFRAKAFEQIVQMLRKLQLVERHKESFQQQLELPTVPQLPSVFVVCGPTCAGKTTTAGWMTDKYGIPHIEASDFMYKAFWERHGLRSAVRIGNFAEAALKTQPDIVAAPIAKHIFDKQFTTVVVTGFRSPEEVEIFCASIKQELKAELLFLDAPKDIRLERAIKRGRDDITPEKFDARNAQEERMGLGRISALFGVKHLENSSTSSVLFRHLRAKYHTTLELGLGTVIQHFLKFDASLEPYILMTLLDCDSWLTTTEIAATLNAKFGLEKNKNNVSRYFNQEYHPFYEVRLRELRDRITNTVEYRLSATGISEAKVLQQAPATWLTRRRPPSKSKSGQYLLL